jgi:hypothetical protein
MKKSSRVDTRHDLKEIFARFLLLVSKGSYFLTLLLTKKLDKTFFLILKKDSRAA